MVCILCYDCNSDFIALSSAESEHIQIPSILFKYFRFIFETKPNSGEICRKCWIKVEMFHTFYQRIETIQMTIIKVPTIVVENIDFHTKIEDDKHSIEYDQMNQVDNKLDKSFSIDAIDKYDDHFDNNFWFDELNASMSEGLKPETVTSDTLDLENSVVEKSPIGNKSKSRGSKYTSNSALKNETSKKKKVRAIKDVKSTSDPQHIYSCPVNRKCTKHFETNDELITHCAVDHKRYHCTHCPNTCLFADLYKHLREVHGIIENAICEHCGQIFGCNRTLQEHIKRKHTISDPVQCDICKEWFKSRETIRSHMNYVHIQGPQTCVICGKVSANRKALRTHLTIHSEAWKDKFKCVICGKGFRSSTKLREHSYIHSGKTDAYICQFCGKSFRFNSSISAHRMKYHPAEMAHVKERLQKKRNMEFKV